MFHIKHIKVTVDNGIEIDEEVENERNSLNGNKLSASVSKHAGVP
jgi:hypothetical protein